MVDVLRVPEFMSVQIGVYIVAQIKVAIRSTTPPHPPAHVSPHIRSLLGDELKTGWIITLFYKEREVNKKTFENAIWLSDLIVPCMESDWSWLLINLLIFFNYSVNNLQLVGLSSRPGLVTWNLKKPTFKP